MMKLLRKILGQAPPLSRGSAAIESPSGARRRLTHESDERFRVLVDSVKDYAIFMFDAEGRVTSWNAGAERILGYTAPEITGKHISQFYLPEDVEAGRPVQELETATSAGRYEEEGWRVRKDGTRFWASVIVTPLEDVSGSLRGFAKVIRDLTEWRKAQEDSRRLAAEEAAREAAEAGQIAAQRAHREEHRQREQLRVTLESIGDGVIVTDVEGRVTFVNAVAQTLTGWSPEQADGRPIGDVFRVVSEDTRRPIQDPVARVIQEGAVTGLSEKALLLSRSGREIPVGDSGAPIRGEDGEISGAVLVFRDVTESRQAAEARMHLAAIVESSDDAIVSKSLDGIIQSWNSGAENLYGYTAEEMIGRHISVTVPPTHPDELHGITERLKRGEHVEQFETVRLRKNGTPVDVSLTISPIRNSEGRMVGASKIARDITAQKRTEASLRFLAEASASLAALGDHASSLGDVARLAVPSFSDHCVIDLVESDGSLRRLCIAPADQSAATLNQRFPPDATAGWGVGNVLRTGMSELRSDPLPAENAVPTSDWLKSFMSVPIRARGRMIGVLSFLSAASGRRFDAFDLRLAEDLANRAAVAIESSRLFSEAKDADRRKDEFLAMLAHELRNPLAPVRTSLEVLASASTMEETLAPRAIMERQVKHLSRLVDDLLDVSRIMQGRIELKREALDVAAVIAAAVETSRPVLEARSQAVVIHVPPEPVLIDGDPTRLAQVLANILNNAAKFSQRPGLVTVTVTLDEGSVVISVRDEGDGIDPRLLPHVFELFIQGDATLERSQGGLGIGLTVVRKLIQLHGGNVSVHSRGVGMGTEVTLKMPVLAAQPASKPVNRDVIPPPKVVRRILVVDDSVDSAEASALLLRAWGHDVRVAHDGPEALQVAADLKPEIVLLDIGLPGMSGFEVVMHLRHRETSRHALIVAVTGYGQDEDRRRALEAGFDKHLTKPVEPPVLRELIASSKALGPTAP